MPYAQEVSRTHQALFVLLIDQSSSMAEPLAGGTSTRGIAVAGVINNWLSELVSRSYQGEGVRDWLDLAVIGFRTSPDGSPVVDSALAGELAGRDCVSITEVAEHPLFERQAASASDAAEESSPASSGTQCPYWVTTKAEGGRPTCTALVRAHEICAGWIEAHPDSFPPIVILVTDGESSEGDPQENAQSLTSLATHDGNVLLWTCSIDSAHAPEEQPHPLWFPASTLTAADDWLRALIAMSSPLPERFLDRIRTQWDLEVRRSPESRGCLLHAGIPDLQRLLGMLIPGDVGTRPVTDAERPFPPAPDVAPPKGAPYVDENVQFTTYCPSQIPAEKYTPLLVFAHLEELPPDAHPDQPEPMEEVQQQAQALLGEAISSYRQSTHESRQAIPRESELTFVVAFEGLRSNPPRHTLFWEEPVHRVEFRLKAPASLEGQTCRGQLTVYLGDILIAQADLRVKVASGESATRAKPQRVATRPYRKIFASYSRRDLAVVEQFERYAAAMGDRYLRDLVDLRSGEEWNPGLERMIREADVFQLFWSRNSMKSEFCRQEWEYALALNRPNFIRPTYWEQPFPEEPPRLPPDELRSRHFQLLGRYIASPPDRSELPEELDAPPAPPVSPGPSPTSDVNAEANRAASPADESLIDENDDLYYEAPDDESGSTHIVMDDDSGSILMGMDDESDDSSPFDLDDSFDDDARIEVDYEDDEDFDAPMASASPMASKGMRMSDDEWQASASKDRFDEMPLAQRLAIFLVCAVLLLGGVIGAAVYFSDEPQPADNSEVHHITQPTDDRDDQVCLSCQVDSGRELSVPQLISDQPTTFPQSWRASITSAEWAGGS